MPSPATWARPRTELERAWPEHDFSTIEEVWWPPIEEPADSVIGRAALFRAEMAALPDWADTLVVSHWGFILSHDRQERHEWPMAALRPERRATRADRLARMIGSTERWRHVPSVLPGADRLPPDHRRNRHGDTNVRDDPSAPADRPAANAAPGGQYPVRQGPVVRGARRAADLHATPRQPQVNINLDVQARRVQDGQSVFEVAIMIRAEAHEAARRGSMARRPPCRRQCSWPN